MIHKTKGIVLRTVKYGETSLVVTMFTELFGTQSYMVNGIRKIGTKGSTRAGMFQPAAILEIVAYHNEFKNLQRLKEFKWDYLYLDVFSDVVKNAVAQFAIEIATKCLKQPEPQPDLFYFIEDALQHLDRADQRVTANFPLFFALHLAVFFGFRITDSYSATQHYLDLNEGSFTPEQPSHQYYLTDKEAEAVSEILKMTQPHELEQVSLNQETRRRILHALEQYYALHIPEFGTMRTLPVLRELF